MKICLVTFANICLSVPAHLSIGGEQDPDLLVRGMDPDPSITKQKY